MIKGKLTDKGPGIGAPFDVGSKRVAWVERPESMGLRRLGFADEIGTRYYPAPVQHQGWHLDPLGDGETARGVVYLLPGRKGQTRAVYGMADPFQDGPAILALWDIQEGESDPFGVADVTRDAARLADHVAEKYAEAEREYQTAWQAGAQWEAAGVELGETRREFLALRRETAARADDGAPAICAALRARLDTLADRWRELKDKRATLASGDSDPWYFWPGDSRMRDAFNDGAGEVVL